MNNADVGKVILIIIVIIGVLFVISWLKRKFKVLNLPCVFFVSGEVKSGKSLLSVHLAIKEYKKALRWWKIKRFLRLLILPFKFKEGYRVVSEIIRKQELAFEYSDLDESFDYAKFIGNLIFTAGEFKELLPPMLYSNIPLACVRYNPFTIDMLNSEVRLPNKSVCLLDEISLVADSQLYKDDNINNKLMRFYKLYGHATHGGKCIIDSQSVLDNHYSIKRCMGSYLYIYERIKFPFITIMKVRQLVYANDGSVQNNFNEDIELSMRKIIIFNTTYDKYDCYAYSVFTDYLPVKAMYCTEIKGKKDDLKCYNIITLNEFVKEMNHSIKNKYPATMEIVNEEGVVNEEEN